MTSCVCAASGPRSLTRLVTGSSSGLTRCLFVDIAHCSLPALPSRRPREIPSFKLNIPSRPPCLRQDSVSLARPPCYRRTCASFVVSRPPLPLRRWKTPCKRCSWMVRSAMSAIGWTLNALAALQVYPPSSKLHHHEPTFGNCPPSRCRLIAVYIQRKIGVIMPLRQVMQSVYELESRTTISKCMSSLHGPKLSAHHERL